MFEGLTARLQVGFAIFIGRAANDVPWEQIAHDLGPVGEGSRHIVIQRGLGSLTKHYDQLRDMLRAMGFQVTVVDIKLHGMASIRSDARQLAKVVNSISAKSLAAGGDGMVTVIGHSKGGISARWYLQRMGGIEHVAQLITLGTPHNGSAPMGHGLVARLAAHGPMAPGMKDILATSSIIKGLNSELPSFMRDASRTHPDFKMVSIAGDLGGLLHGQDGLVSVGNAQLRAGGARNAFNLVLHDGGANHMDIAANINVHEPTMRMMIPMLAGEGVPTPQAVQDIIDGVRNLRPIPSGSAAQDARAISMHWGH